MSSANTDTGRGVDEADGIDNRTPKAGILRCKLTKLAKVALAIGIGALKMAQSHTALERKLSIACR